MINEPRKWLFGRAWRHEHPAVRVFAVVVAGEDGLLQEAVLRLLIPLPARAAVLDRVKAKLLAVAPLSPVASPSLAALAATITFANMYLFSPVPPRLRRP